MTRRNFLSFSTAVGFSMMVSAEEIGTVQKEINAVAPLLETVQQHMFPPGGQLPSAKEMHMTTFLIKTVMHASYDRDIRAFVIEGAKELYERTEGRLTAMNRAEKEKALRSYEETHYGRNWLHRIMTLGMEALFSDPVYGSNTNEAAWKAVSSFGGIPRPKTRYIGL